MGYILLVSEVLSRLKGETAKATLGSCVISTLLLVNLKLSLFMSVCLHCACREEYPKQARD